MTTSFIAHSGLLFTGAVLAVPAVQGPAQFFSLLILATAGLVVFNHALKQKMARVPVIGACGYFHVKH
jgi:hypothetical protein